MARTELVVGLGDELFSVERPWGELPSGVAISDVSDVAVDSRISVYVFQRADPPIVIFESDGTFAGAWGSGALADAHGIFITPDDRVLLCDRDAHQVLVLRPRWEAASCAGERHRPTSRRPSTTPPMSRPHRRRYRRG